MHKRVDHDACRPPAGKRGDNTNTHRKIPGSQNDIRPGVPRLVEPRRDANRRIGWCIPKTLRRSRIRRPHQLPA